MPQLGRRFPGAPRHSAGLATGTVLPAVCSPADDPVPGGPRARPPPPPAALTRPRSRPGARPGLLEEFAGSNPEPGAPQPADTIKPPPEGGQRAARRHSASPVTSPRPPSRAPRRTEAPTLPGVCRGGLAAQEWRGTRLGGAGVPQARPVEGAGSGGSEWPRPRAVPESPPSGRRRLVAVGGPPRARGGGAWRPGSAEPGIPEHESRVTAALACLQRVGVLWGARLGAEEGLQSRREGASPETTVRRRLAGPAGSSRGRFPPQGRPFLRGPLDLLPVA
ncbi:proline-rich protein HaeIII subfamily 1-like [Choloepus didactylus]|uniref:proline-rich protein HaeIII subfamily 1-like n=1 Tax=Choloepus didactylus TaxID=27675 RepID=UPI00189F9850|nr:proline-rich protein HaeIII subfamily 1-like [Choloepus didactylus]